MKYVADDGKEFNNPDDCLKYEGEQKVLKETEEARWREVEKARENYIRILNKWKEDYAADLEISSIPSDIIKTVMRELFY